MNWLRPLLAAIAFLQPLFWVTNTALPLAYSADRLMGGASLGGIFFTPMGLFFTGLRFPFRSRFMLIACAVTLFVSLAVLFWRLAANWFRGRP